MNNSYKFSLIDSAFVNLKLLVVSLKSKISFNIFPTMDAFYLVCYLFKVFNNYMESYKFKGIKFQLCKYKQIFVGFVWFYRMKYSNIPFIR